MPSPNRRLIVMLLYGSGVRLEECLDLRVKDLDFDREVEIMGARLSLADLVLDQTRHMQHHVGAMHTRLRRHLGSAPPWVGLG